MARRIDKCSLSETAGRPTIEDCANLACAYQYMRRLMHDCMMQVRPKKEQDRVVKKYIEKLDSMKFTLEDMFYELYPDREFKDIFSNERVAYWRLSSKSRIKEVPMRKK